MLYLIGGAARAGKTLIAQRMLRERLIPYLDVSNDFLDVVGKAYAMLCGSQGEGK